MNWSEKLKSPFPFYLADDRKNFTLILAISAFVVVFLHVYKPYNFHTDLTTPQEFLFGGVTLVILSLDILLLPKLFPKTFDPLNWTMGKYMALTMLHLVLIGIVSTAIDDIFICPE